MITSFFYRPKHTTMRHGIFLILLVITPSLITAQDCDCTSNFLWAKKTFEENDAGFSFALDKKGEKAYQEHNEIFSERIAAINDPSECAGVIYEWLLFFRNGHVGVRNLVQNGAGSSTDESSDQDIIDHYKDWEKHEVDVPDFKSYLDQKEEEGIEGIWVSEPYTVGIQKVGGDYVGFIIEADGVYWTQGQVKLRIHADGQTDFYMRDHSKQTFDRTELIGTNYLQMGFVTFERAEIKNADGPMVKRYFAAMSASKPYFEKIDEQTSYIRIPTFNGAEKGVIDGVIHANKETILSTENLIIDIRNNGGGSDRSYKELLPFMYTNPIRVVGMDMYSTPLNNQRMLDFINKKEYGFSDYEKQWAQESYDVLSKHIGEFVNLDSEEVDIKSYDTIFPFPKNVGIIINENNGSTAEQFLLAAKQSKKVKLFGTTTVGVLDISNMYFVKSPCEEFELGYCLSKSLRIPHMAIDDIGIQPDYFIDSTIKSYHWIEHVRASLNP